MPNELFLKEGQECYYEEDGGQYRVKIIKRWTRADFLCFKLEVLEILFSSPIVKDPKIGEIFDVGKKIGCSLSRASWELEPIN